MLGRGRLRRWLVRLPRVRAAVAAIRRAATAIGTFGEELRFLFDAARLMRGTDLLLLTGSGVLSDHFGGAMNCPWTIFRWVVLARMAGARVAILSAGAGPLDSPLSRFLIQRSLRLAWYRSYRDETSARVIDALGVPGRATIVPDLAYSLEFPRPPARQPDCRPLVGINAFPHNPRYWPLADDRVYRRYVRALAIFAGWLLDNKYRVYFFPTQLRADPPVIADVKAILVTDSREGLAEELVDRPTGDVPQLLDTLAETDVVVATRFHAIALALAVPAPVLAISNHHKMSDLMKAAGQGRYLLDVETVTAEALIERFTLLEFNADAIRGELRHHIAGYRRALEQQYDLVLAPSGGDTQETCR